MTQTTDYCQTTDTNDRIVILAIRLRTCKQKTTQQRRRWVFWETQTRAKIIQNFFLSSKLDGQTSCEVNYVTLLHEIGKRIGEMLKIKY